MASSGVRHLVQRLNAHPRVRDAVSAVVYLLLGLALLQLGGYRLWAVTTLFSPSFSAPVSLLLLIMMAALATMRSTRPFLVLTLSMPLVAADLLGGSSLGVVILFGDFVYCAFRYGGDRGVRILLTLIIGACVVVGIVLVALPEAGARFASVFLQWVLIVLVAALWGWNVRSERQRTRSDLADAHLLSTQRMRQRIAGDLHDLVANEIAVAGLSIEAARLRIPRSTDGFDEIDESLTRAASGAEGAHSELRRLIALLTAVDVVFETPDRAAHHDLDRLVPVGRRLVRQGKDLDGALGALPARAAGIAMRVVQELVTNAVRYGTGDIVLTVADGSAMIVRVSNAVSTAPAGMPGTGIGITGAALLLEEVGGTVEAHIGADSRWSAELTIPQEQYA